MTIHLERGKLLLQQRRYDDALREITLHLSLMPNDDEGHLFRGVCLFHKDKYDEAIGAIEQSIALYPQNAFAFYMLSRIMTAQENYVAARKKIDEAIAMQPMHADFFAWSAQLFLLDKEYSKALAHANEGLAIAPDNVDCLNQRTMALVKLDKKEEAFDAIDSALTEDPENSLTHANTGWAMLEHGEHKRALTHFTESLRLNPNNYWAKEGMVEALKARYFVYRIFLKYMFWIGNLKGNIQWIIILGFYVLQNILRQAARTYPQFEPIIMPFIFAYVAFALSTWVLQPLFNVLLLVHPQGRYALSPGEKKISIAVGVALLGCVVAFVTYLITRGETTLLIAIFAFSIMIPISGLDRYRNKKQKYLLRAFAIALTILGLATIAVCSLGGDYTVPGSLYLGILLIYQFMSNSFAIRR